MILPALALGFGHRRPHRPADARQHPTSAERGLHPHGARQRTARTPGDHLHVLKNAMIPVVTVLGPLLAYLMAGTFVVETIFGIPGMGKYFVISVTGRDYPVIMGTIC